MIYQNEPDYGEREIEAIVSYLRSGSWLTEYKRTREFERLFAEYLGVKYAVAVPSGTIALTLAIMGLGIKGEVIVPDYSFIASATSVELAGAVPRMVDVELDTHCLCPEKVEETINANTEAIIIVPNNGRTPKYMEQLLCIAAENNLAVIEDSCQCFGSKWGDRYFGTIGDIGCFSLSHHKVVTTGQGGMIVTYDDDLYNRMCSIKNYGRSLQSGLQEYGRPGFNFKFNDILASIGIVQINSVSEKLEKKRRIYQRYRDNLCKIVNFPPVKEGNLISVVDIMIDNPFALQEYLLKYSIETRLFYPPIHNYFDGLTDDDFPNATYLTQRGLWLPSSTTLSLELIDWICKLIKQYYLI